MSNIIRPEVDKFSRSMENQLVKHDTERGDGWKEAEATFLWASLSESLDKLQDQLNDTKQAMTADDFDAVVVKLRAKCADAANFLMFIAEHYDPTNGLGGNG